MHTSNKHAHLYTYVWTYSYTHKRRSKSCVRLPTHVFHITRSYQQKQIFYIYRVVFFLSRLLSSAKRAPLCRNEWSLQQTNVWWETPPRGATVWVVSHNTWHLTPISTVPTNNTRPQVAQSNSQKDSVSADSRMTGRNCERMRVWTSGCTIFVVLLLSLAVYLRFFAFIWNDNSWWPASLQSVVYAWGNMVQTKIICQTEEFEEHCGKYLDIFCSM